MDGRGQNVAILIVIMVAMFLLMVIRTNAIPIGTTIIFTIVINTTFMTRICNGNLARTIAYYLQRKTLP